MRKPVTKHKYVRLHLDGVPGDRRDRDGKLDGVCRGGWRAAGNGDRV